MSDPVVKNSAEMYFTERDHPVETLSTHRADQPLAMSVRLRHPHRRLQNGQTGTRQHPVDPLREDAVTIVNQKSVLWVAWRRHSQLLEGPLGGRLVSEIPVDDPSGLHLQDYEDVQQLESQGDRHEEVTSEHGSRVVLDKCAPALRSGSAAGAVTSRHVASHRPRRDPDAQFQQELGRYPLLAPGPVRGRHLFDQPLQLRWDSRSPRTLRFRAPEQPESLSMPSNQRVGLHD